MSWGMKLGFAWCASYISFFYLLSVWFFRIFFHFPERSIDSSRFYCFMSSFRMLPNFYVLRFPSYFLRGSRGESLKRGILLHPCRFRGFRRPLSTFRRFRCSESTLCFLFLHDPFWNITSDSDVVSPVLTDRRYIYTVHFRVVRLLYIPTFRFPFYHDSSRTFHSDTSFPIHLRLREFTLRLGFRTVHTFSPALDSPSVSEIDTYIS
ncbi:hypothetical protein PM082_013749 [Marasmius tenuissimus]|nr:hypothetical protein PM082_013745 [Marasmius tenuissimus]KAJ8088196.1 hypothetical protein PM082_013747 [Marasmius tenuissimus]KAJ8088198.1 hypothetical protein PM082_013749 [Marasmius tenuissimus]